MSKAELEARRDESTDTFRFKFAHNGYSSGKNYRLVFELLKKVIAEKKIAIEVIEIPCKEIQDLEYQLQSANAKLAVATKDTERLDWMIENPGALAGIDQQWFINERILDPIKESVQLYATPRSAIDAAMKED